MKRDRQYWGFVVALCVGLTLVLGTGFTQSARAASEDAGMFYNELEQHGQWFEYENYGPVWQPSRVGEGWRPYTDGRWVPTKQGYVFESQEPWGWATYHYGNWMPTAGYGWVWVPGRTWYPSTVEWRTSRKDVAVNASYVGWAPIPPPNYVPPPAYAPSTYGTPGADLLTPPLWIFAKAVSFLLGFGQPYTPAYSYTSQPVLAPPSYVPVFYRQTTIVPNYYTPRVLRSGRLRGPRPSYGAYSGGPPVDYISRVTNINRTIINNNITNNTNNISRFNNVVPPQQLVDRNAYIRQIVPPALLQGQPLPASKPAANVRLARANLGKPNTLAAPQGVPPLTAKIPRMQPQPVGPGRGVPGAGLPAKALMPLTPQMEQQVQKLPPKQQIVPINPLPIQPVAVQPAVPAEPAVKAKPAVPAEPAVKAKPEVPGQPAVPAEPTVKGKPAVKEKPAKPAKPAVPAEPAVKAKPAVPAEPAVKAKPEVPAQPAVPAEPAVKGKPAVKEKPAKPAKPAVPAEPAVKAKPAVPAEPAVKAKPEVPAQPAVPAEPAVKGKPAVKERPAMPARPAIPAEPAVKGKPAIPAEPAVPGKPAIPGQQRQQQQKEKPQPE